MNEVKALRVDAYALPYSRASDWLGGGIFLVFVLGERHCNC